MAENLYRQYSNGQCPHCRVIVRFGSPSASITSLRISGGNDMILVYSSVCPSCQKPIIVAKITENGEPMKLRLVHPFNVTRKAPLEVPESIRADFHEATSVLSISEKASAALSRRCLQSLLTDQGFKQNTLNDQIEEAIKKLPTNLAENLDQIRVVGNYAAHEMKYKATGLIVDVEPQEAAWNLDVLEELFDYFYVQPKKATAKRLLLEKKLKEMGKPPLKKPKTVSK